MNNRISVITPSFNQGTFIERTIKSVLEQNTPPFEYLIMDGGSSDETLTILKKYESQITWDSQPDKGQSDAVNKGLTQAKGDIIGWLNSDDIYYPGTLQFVCEYFRQHPAVDIIYGNANFIDSDDKIIEPYYTETWNFERFKEYPYLCQPAVFFRRSIIEQHGLLNINLSYCMDYEYWIRLAKGGSSFIYVDNYLAGSRVHQATKTVGSRPQVLYEINKMMLQHFGYVPDRWLSNYAHDKLEQKNITRTNKNFAKIVALRTLLASLRWNKKIKKSTLLMVLNWLK
jgi:glycosyltransferase involved in cell wall biosynthesis